MKVLHLYSDWKWTGPSQPVLNLCAGLHQAGLETHLACLSAPAKLDTYQPINLSTNQPVRRTLPAQAKDTGIHLFTLPAPPKYLSLFYIRPHINALAGYIQASHNFDIIHCHSALDHYYASRLRHSCEGRNPGSFKIIRTNHKGYPLETTWSNKSLMKKALDGYIALSPKLLEADQKTFNLTIEKTAAIPSGIDSRRFHGLNQPQTASDNTRNSLGLKDNDIVVGIVARVQSHRRFHIILDAMTQVVKEMPNVKLVIVGRGTYYNELVTGPVEELGLKNNVISAGYRTEDYLDILNAFDFGLFLVPGSDGSCRAALELMASNKPLIVAQRGILPEMVDNDQNGLVIDDTPCNLAQAILKLAKDKSLRERFGQSARQKIAQQFTIERTVKLTSEFYSTTIKKTF